MDAETKRNVDQALRLGADLARERIEVEASRSSHYTVSLTFHAQDGKIRRVSSNSEDSHLLAKL